MLPDADVAGLYLGVDYGHWLGHRGFSHSLTGLATNANASTLPWCYRHEPLHDAAILHAHAI